MSSVWTDGRPRLGHVICGVGFCFSRLVASSLPFLPFLLLRIITGKCGGPLSQRTRPGFRSRVGALIVGGTLGGSSPAAVCRLPPSLRNSQVTSLCDSSAATSLSFHLIPGQHRVCNYLHFLPWEQARKFRNEQLQTEWAKGSSAFPSSSPSPLRNNY